MGRLTQVLTGTLLAGLAAVGGGLLYSAVGIRRDRPLPLAVDAERHELSAPAFGRISYYHDPGPGTGRPLLLVHSVNAAASAYEVRPLFEQYRGTRPVYAVELPGFGFSERTERDYTPALFVAAVEAMLTDVIDAPADVVALSLGAEFAAMAAQRAPEQVRSLALIAPTGFQEDGPSGASQLAWPFRVPILNQALYDLIASPPSLRYFLGLSFVGDIPQDLLDYDRRTALQPGAAYAPYAFVSGVLFTPDVRQRTYAALSQPVLVLYSTSSFVGYEALGPLVADRERWRAVELDGVKDLPQFERLDETVRQLDAFWGSAP